MVDAGPNTAAASLKPVSYEALANWVHDDHFLALDAFRKSAEAFAKARLNFAKHPTFAGQSGDWSEIFADSLHPDAGLNPRGFFEKNFIPVEIIDTHRPDGLFTGYFEPLVKGSRNHSNDFPVPVLGKPDDLRTFDETETAKAGCNYGRQTAEGPCAYPTRKEIEQGCLAGRNLEICWLSDWVDGFFMHVQGSGRVQLDDGTTMRLSYAAKSGQPYVAIGGVLVQRGVLTRDTMSMQSLKAWMKSNPNEARELMWQNPSYIFFRETGAAPENRGSIGAGKVHLTPHRSIAIDASHYLYGTPLWLETATPAESPGSAQPFHHLMIAQDTGSAIQGLVRGDVYWGWGEEAAIIAGHMKSSGKMTALLPRAVVERLGLMT